MCRFKILLLYVVATTQVISVALVVEQEEPRHVYKVQRPVYYIGKVLSDCETRYNQVQKLLYTILLWNTSFCTISKVTWSMWLCHTDWGKLSGAT
jgi:hypothetical protein